MRHIEYADAFKCFHTISKKLCRKQRLLAFAQLFDLFFFALEGFKLVMRPLSVPAVSSITALISVGLRERTASSIALRSAAGVVACTPTPPKASISLS